MDAVNHIKLAIPRAQALPALRALLYAIFFQRSMDTVEPETYDVGDAHVACAPTAAIEKEVGSKLEEFAVEFLESGLDKGEIAIVFLQKRPRKGWFAVTEELVPWELHLITLTLLSSSSASEHPSQYPSHASPSRLSRTATGSVSLVPALGQILAFCAEKRYNVPVLSSGEGGGLSHQIMINPPPASELFSPPLPPSTGNTTAATTTAAALNPNTAPPARALSPPPSSTTSTSPALATAHSHAHAHAHTYGRSRDYPSTGGAGVSGASGNTTAGQGDKTYMPRRGSAPVPASMGGYGQGQWTENVTHETSSTQGYLEQAKDGLRAVRAGAGVVAGWAGAGRKGV